MLQSQLEQLPFETLERVNRAGGLEIYNLLDLILHPKDYTVHCPDDVAVDDVTKYEGISEDARSIGRESLKDGTTAYCILAGGAGTRIGVSKAFLRLPGTSSSLLSLKLLQSEMAQNIWVMTSPSNHDDIQRHLAEIGASHVKLFTQYESFRLTPDNQLVLQDGKPAMHPCGHGDLIPALQHSGILSDFVRGGGKRVVVTNVDNVLGAPDSKIIGHHIANNSSVTCEVVGRREKDVGGFLCNHNGFNQIVEHFRMSGETEIHQFKWLNTNSFIFNADLDFEQIKWSWHRVKKNVDGQLMVQYERLIQDLTSHFVTSYIGIERACRYMPVKTSEDLQEAARLLGRKSE